MPIASFKKGHGGIGWCWFGAVLLYAGLATAESAEMAGGRSSPLLETSNVEPRVHRYSKGDGVYGRLTGDLDLSPKIGTSYNGNWNAAFGAGAWYFWTAGLSFFDSEALSDRQGYPKGQSAISVEIRPLFIPRWSRDLEQGPAMLDLVLDSIELGVGVYFNRGAHAGVEKRGLQASLGMGVPLLADARGPWIELFGIHRFAENENSSDNAVLVALSWHWLVSTGRHGQ